MRFLYEGLKKYDQDVEVRFHMPGHKGKTIIDIDNVFDIDVTEVDGTDNLQNPKDILKKSQEYVSSVYGSVETLYSVSGSTGGLYAAILSTTNPSDEILVQRNCHISVYNAMMLGRLKPKYIYPEIDEKNGIVCSINVKELDQILDNNKKIKAVVITNPSYYGTCSNISLIVEVVHKHNRVLIVDEAHGAHLRFSEKLPTSALDKGADIVVQSTHKTLGAFTQTSIVHVGTDRVDINRLKMFLNMCQSTSPSYILMSSIEASVKHINENKDDRLLNILAKIKEVKEELKAIDGVKIYDLTTSDVKVYEFDDMKLLISLSSLGISGVQLENILRHEYKIQVEMSDLKYVLAMITIGDDIDDIDKLKKAIIDIATTRDKKDEESKRFNIDFNKPIISEDLTTAFYSEKETVLLENAQGKVSGGFVTPYPPGVPLLCAGEVITKELIKQIKEFYSNGIEILGVKIKKGIYVEVLK